MTILTIYNPCQNNKLESVRVLLLVVVGVCLFLFFLGGGRGKKEKKREEHAASSRRSCKLLLLYTQLSLSAPPYYGHHPTMPLLAQKIKPDIYIITTEKIYIISAFKMRTTPPLRTTPSSLGKKLVRLLY